MNEQGPPTDDANPKVRHPPDHIAHDGPALGRHASGRERQQSDWLPPTADRRSSMVRLSARLPNITVVAHTVGGPETATRQGGTEVQVAALIEGYLDAVG